MYTTKQGKNRSTHARALALAALAGLHGACAAQGGVTIYGVLNPGISVVDNVAGQRMTVMSEGLIQPSRLGFKGSEDLGGGLSAVFQLESGINVKNGALGQGGLLFGRQAYVGLNSKRLGTLTLERQYTFMYDNFLLMSNGVLTYNVYAFKLGDADGVGSQRFNNAVKYVSPVVGGFQAGIMHGLGEVPDSSKKQSNDSAGLTYTAAGVKVAAAWALQRDSRPAMPIGVDVLGQALNLTTFDRIEMAGLGVQGGVGGVDLHALATTVDYELADRSTRLKMLEVGAVRPLTPALSAALGYNHYRIEGARLHHVSAGLDYLLSKRSDIAIAYAAIRGSEGTHPLMYTTPGVPDGRSQRVFSIGIRHRF